MSRYQVISEWETDDYDRSPVTIVGFNDETGDHTTTTFAIQVADIKDTKASYNATYKRGAHRIVKNGKAIRGKGGTTPFFGELAWCNAVRLFDDLVFAAHREAR